MDNDLLELISKILGISAFVYGLFKAYKKYCQDELAMTRDLNHIKNSLQQISLELGTFEDQVHSEFKNIDNRIDKIDVAVAEIRGKCLMK